MNVLDLIGAWQLVEFKMRNRDGDINDMQGWIKRGLIIYSTDGHMSATLCMSEQPLRFQSDQVIHAHRFLTFIICVTMTLMAASIMAM